MDGFQDGGYIWAQGDLSYHVTKVPWWLMTKISRKKNILKIITLKFGSNFNILDRIKIYCSTKMGSWALIWRGATRVSLVGSSLVLSTVPCRTRDDKESLYCNVVPGESEVSAYFRTALHKKLRIWTFKTNLLSIFSTNPKKILFEVQN